MKSGETFYDSLMAFELYAKSSRKPSRDYKQLNDMMMEMGFMMGDLQPPKRKT